MKRMYDKKQLEKLIEERTSLKFLMDNATDITGLPAEGELVSPYKEVIEKAVNNRVILLNSLYFFITYSSIEAGSGGDWVGGFSSPDTTTLLKVSIDEVDKTYTIEYIEY